MVTQLSTIHFSKVLIAVVLACTTNANARDALHAPPTEAVAQLSIDLGAPAAPPLPGWWRRLGSGHATLTTRSDWQSAMREAAGVMGGLHSVRFHGIMDDDMSTLLGVEPDGSLITSFASVDASWDVLLANKVQPYVELSFMPEALASNASETVFHYKGGTSPPRNHSQWADLVTALVQHAVDRHGLAEVASWQFEVWNEPNCGFWAGNQQQYFELYNVTSRAVKAVHPSLKVGGPSTCQAGWLPEFLDFIHDSGAPVDFLSTHLYPTDPQVPKSRTGFVDVVANASRIAASAKLPLVFSEYNAGLAPASQGCDLDGAYAAAFIVHAVAQLKETWENLQASGDDAGFSYWAISDVFEEGGMSSVEYHNGYGVQTIGGVPKPALRAFALLDTVSGSGDAALVKLDGAGATNLDALAYISQPSQRRGSVAPTTSRRASVLVSNWAPYWMTNVPSVSATISVADACCGSVCPTEGTVTRLDSKNGNAHATWNSMGSPLYPTPEQIAKLKSASEAGVHNVTLSTAGAGEVSATVSVEPQAVFLLSFDIPC